MLHLPVSKHHSAIAHLLGSDVTLLTAYAIHHQQNAPLSILALQTPPAPAPANQNHDVREEVFRIAQPTGWSVEAEDPPGLRCKLFKCVT